MTACVLDASITGAWLFAEERTEGVLTLFRGLSDGPAVVPALWHTETVNLLLVAERRHRITADTGAALLDLLGGLDIETDDDPSRAQGPVLDLARRHGLTAYDATYLDLAVRRRLPLATRDAALIRAARALGHPVIDGATNQ
jgi:predicted nucleic acid-binding protein